MGSEEAWIGAHTVGGESIVSAGNPKATRRFAGKVHIRLNPGGVVDLHDTTGKKISAEQARLSLFFETSAKMRGLLRDDGVERDMSAPEPDELSQKLRVWKVDPPIPSRFHSEVWRERQKAAFSRECDRRLRPPALAAI